MIEGVRTSASPLHDLLLGLAGRVDDDLLAWARELLAVGEAGQAVELVGAALVAERVVLPAPLREAVVAAAGTDRTDLDVDAALPPAADGEDGTPHRFAADAAAGDAVVAALTALPARRLAGCTLHLTWRCTPAGAAPGPVPWAVVLVEAEPDRSADVLAYLLATELDRAGAPAAVEVFPTGATLPPYHATALESARPVAVGVARGAGPDGARPVVPGLPELPSAGRSGDDGASTGGPRPASGRRRRAEPADPPDLPVPGAGSDRTPEAAPATDPFRRLTDAAPRTPPPEPSAPGTPDRGVPTAADATPGGGSVERQDAVAADPAPAAPADVPQEWEHDWRSGEWAMPRPAPEPAPAPAGTSDDDPVPAGTERPVPPWEEPLPAAADAVLPRRDRASDPLSSGFTWNLGSGSAAPGPAGGDPGPGFTWNNDLGAAGPAGGDPGPGFTWNSDLGGAGPAGGDPGPGFTWNNDLGAAGPATGDSRSGSPYGGPGDPRDAGARDGGARDGSAWDGSAWDGSAWDGEPAAAGPAAGDPGSGFPWGRPGTGGRYDVRDDPAPRNGGVADRGSGSTARTPWDGAADDPDRAATAGHPTVEPPTGRGFAAVDPTRTPAHAEQALPRRTARNGRGGTGPGQPIGRRPDADGVSLFESPTGRVEPPTGRVEPPTGRVEPPAGRGEPPRPRPRPRPDPSTADAEQPPGEAAWPGRPSGPGGGVSFQDDPLFGPAPELPPDPGVPLLGDAPAGPGEPRPGRGPEPPESGPDRPTPPENGLPRRSRRPGPYGAVGRPQVPDPAHPVDDGRPAPDPAPPSDATPAAVFDAPPAAVFDVGELGGTERDLLDQLQAELGSREARPRPYRRAGRNGRAVNGRAHPGADGGPPDLAG